jgi:RNA polymerase sigma-70 factor (ECF subfamily)
MTSRSIVRAEGFAVTSQSSATDSTGRLIDRARGGDAAAVANLLESYRNYLGMLARTWVTRSLQGKGDASDLVQETLLKAHERFDQFRGRTEPEIAVWLRQILARCLADFGRRFQREGRQVNHERSLESLLNESSVAMGRMLSASVSSPSQSASRRELSVVLADALADLSPDHREVIWLRSLQELDWDEIGRRLNRTARAARMLWTRALQELRPRIEARM